MMMEAFGKVTDILFTDSLEGLALKYEKEDGHTWTDHFDHWSRFSGEVYRVLFPPEVIDFEDYETRETKMFVYAMLPKNGKTADTELSCFRELTDRALYTLHWAKDRLKLSPYQMFLDNPDLRPRIPHIRKYKLCNCASNCRCIPADSTHADKVRKQTYV